MQCLTQPFRYLAEAQTKCERNRIKYERLAKILVNVKAGIEHLADKLESVPMEGAPIAMSDETVLEA